MLCGEFYGFMPKCSRFFQDQLTLELDSPVIHVETVNVEGNMSATCLSYEEAVGGGFK